MWYFRLTIGWKNVKCSKCSQQVRKQLIREWTFEGESLNKFGRDGKQWERETETGLLVRGELLRVLDSQKATWNIVVPEARIRARYEHSPSIVLEKNNPHKKLLLPIVQWIHDWFQVVVWLNNNHDISDPLKNK